MPTDLLFHPAEVGPFRLVAGLAVLSLRKLQGVDDHRYDGVCARNHIHLVEEEHPEIGGGVVGDPKGASRISANNLDCELFGKSHEAGVMAADPALTDEGLAKLLAGKSGPEVALSCGGRIAQLLGVAINSASSSSWHRTILQTLLCNQMQPIIAKAA